MISYITMAVLTAIAGWMWYGLCRNKLRNVLYMLF